MAVSIYEDKLEDLDKRLKGQEKDIETLKGDLKSQKNHQLEYNKVEVSKKLNQIESKLKDLEKRKASSAQSMGNSSDELREVRTEFLEFRKDNDLTLRAIRKQLTELKRDHDNLENKCDSLESYWNRINKEFERFSDNHRNDMDKNMRKVENMVESERKLMSMIKETQEEVNQNIEKLEKRMKETIVDIQTKNQNLNQDVLEARKTIEEFKNEYGPTINAIKDDLSPSQSKFVTSETGQDIQRISERLNSVEIALEKILANLEKANVPADTKSHPTNRKNQEKKSTESSGSSYRDTGSSETEKLENFVSSSRSRPLRSSDLLRKYQYPSSLGSKYDSSLRFSPRIQYSYPRERRRMVAPTSTSLLALIRRTGRLLKNEALDIDFLGNYKFLSDIPSDILRRDADSDERAMRKLAQIRFDIDEKLKRLDSLISQRR